jgi:hypothetical protein
MQPCGIMSSCPSLLEDYGLLKGKVWGLVIALSQYLASVYMAHNTEMLNWIELLLLVSGWALL